MSGGYGDNRVARARRVALWLSLGPASCTARSEFYGSPAAEPCVVAPDADADGSAAVACGGRDCDDADFRVGPAAPEHRDAADSCSDGRDNDCDGLTDANAPACPLGNGFAGALVWEHPLPHGFTFFC